MRDVRIRLQQKLFQIPVWVEVNVFEKHLFEAILPSGLWNVSLVCILQFSLRHAKIKRREMDISVVVQIPLLCCAREGFFIFDLQMMSLRLLQGLSTRT